MARILKKPLALLGITRRSKTQKPLEIQLYFASEAEVSRPLERRKSKSVSISYAIPVHNEGAVYLEPLFKQLFKHLKPEDEIVVVDDFSDEPSTIATLEKYRDKIKLRQRALNGHFGEQKNYLKSLCSKKYVFQIDADEMLGDTFLLHLKYLLLHNPEVELFYVPRVNLVDGLTEEDIENADWTMNEKGWINSPDYQSRIIKNIPRVKWAGHLHEIIRGQDTCAHLPYHDDTYSIIHRKHMERWRRQEAFYQTLM